MNSLTNLMITYFMLIIVMLSVLGVLVMDKQEEILTKIECKKN